MNEEFIVITDEEGSELECELLDVIAFGGESYSVLLPVDDDSSEPELIILRENERGELEGFDDPEILDKVFGIFLDKSSQN